jgi:hypothetical protein
VQGNETQNNVAPPSSSAANIREGSAKNVLPAEIFLRCGYIEMEKLALKIVYRSFGEQHTAYISARDARSIQESGAFPVNVQLIYDDTGTPVIKEIGKAWRSRSGRALVLRTVDSDGELIVPWERFKQVTRGELVKAYVSRIVTTVRSPSVLRSSDNDVDLKECFE